MALTDTAAAVIGVIVAVWLWRGAEVNKPALEPQFLQRVWYWDDFYDTVIGRPGQRLATFLAWVVDARVIDGAVNGTTRPGEGHRHRGPQAADRLRPQLRAGHRPRDGPHHRLHAEPDVVGMTTPHRPLPDAPDPAATAGALALALLGLYKDVHREAVYALALIVSGVHADPRRLRDGGHEGA